jgi:hypothetical protein
MTGRAFDLRGTTLPPSTRRIDLQTAGAHSIVVTGETP